MQIDVSYFRNPLIPRISTNSNTPSRGCFHGLNHGLIIIEYLLVLGNIHGWVKKYESDIIDQLSGVSEKVLWRVINIILLI